MVYLLCVCLVYICPKQDRYYTTEIMVWLYGNLCRVKEDANLWL